MDVCSLLCPRNIKTNQNHTVTSMWLKTLQWLHTWSRHKRCFFLRSMAPSNKDHYYLIMGVLIKMIVTFCYIEGENKNCVKYTGRILWNLMFNYFHEIILYHYLEAICIKYKSIYFQLLKNHWLQIYKQEKKKIPPMKTDKN